MDLDRIRQIAITGIFSDDELLDLLVLKGGVALYLIHRVGTRSSVDIDLSMDRDICSVEATGRRLRDAVTRRFAAEGLALFDYTFEARPSIPDQDPRWGGYRAQFKLIDERKYRDFGNDLERMRREAEVVGPLHKRVFSIDISKHEFVGEPLAQELDHFTIHVYTLPMIAIEKLRAICQQMPSYSKNRTRRPRARDFYDIFVAVREGVDLLAPQNLELVRNSFEAKEVELAMLARISDHREFHRLDWPAVENSVAEGLRGFDYYFEFVAEQAGRISHALRKV